MTIEQRGELIVQIIQTLKAVSKIQKKYFNEGDTFFALAFMTDEELNRIAKLVLV